MRAVLLLRPGIPVPGQLDAAAAWLTANRPVSLVLVTGAPATALAAVRDGDAVVVLVAYAGGHLAATLGGAVRAAGGVLEFTARPRLAVA